MSATAKTATAKKTTSKKAKKKVAKASSRGVAAETKPSRPSSPPKKKAAGKSALSETPEKPASSKKAAKKTAKKPASKKTATTSADAAGVKSPPPKVAAEKAEGESAKKQPKLPKKRATKKTPSVRPPASAKAPEAAVAKTAREGTAPSVSAPAGAALKAPVSAPAQRSPRPSRVSELPDLSTVDENVEHIAGHPDSELTPKEVAFLYHKLVEKRATLVADFDRHLQEALEDGGVLPDETDMAQRSTEQAYLIRFADKERKLLEEIDLALEKLRLGEYGVCEGTEEAIGFKRLELRPWTRYSVAFKEQIERERSQRRR